MVSCCCCSCYLASGGEDLAQLATPPPGAGGFVPPTQLKLLDKSSVEASATYNWKRKSIMVIHQMNPFEVGQVKAHVEHGLSAKQISERVFKADGETMFGETAIQNCINKLYANPGWRGERQKGTGPVRKTTPKQDKDMI